MPIPGSADGASLSHRRLGCAPGEPCAHPPSIGEEPFDDQRRGPNSTWIGTEAPRLDHDATDRIPQRPGGGYLANSRQQSRTDKLPDPAADDDALRVEEVYQVRHAGSNELGSLVEHLRGRLARASRVQQVLHPPLLIFLVAERLPRALRPTLQDSSGADVGLEAARRATSALSAPDHHTRVPPLARARSGTAVEGAVVEERGPNSGAEQHNREMACIAARSKPELGASHRLGAVVEHDRCRERGGHELKQRDLVPAQAWRVNVFLAVVDHHAGNAYPDAKQVSDRNAYFPDQLIDAPGDERDQRTGRLPRQSQRLFDRAQLVQGQIEELDRGAGLPHIYSDHPCMRGIDRDEDRRAAAV